MSVWLAFLLQSFAVLAGAVVVVAALCWLIGRLDADFKIDCEED